MRHEERVQIMKEGYKALYDKLEAHSMHARLPRQVDSRKLERLYDKIDSEYEWVLRKKR